MGRLKRVLFCCFILIPIAPIWPQTIFENVTTTAGVEVDHAIDVHMDPLGIDTGVAWGDFDNDGWVDVYVTNKDTSVADVLFKNNTDGTFTDVTNSAFSPLPKQSGSGAAFADYDNDGDLDLYVCRSGENALFQNNGDATFTDVTVTAFAGAPVDSGRTQTVSWGDYDNDGYLDFFYANHETWGDPPPSPDTVRKDHLFHNNGNGTFTDVSDLLGDARDTYGFTGSWVDYDNDGDVDLYLITDCKYGTAKKDPDKQTADEADFKLWRNDGSDGVGGWIFSEIANSIGLGLCANGMGLATGDYNSDGFLDFAYSNIGPSGLLENQGDGTYANVAAARGVEFGTSTDDIETVSWGLEFFDYDNDGYEDLYIVAGWLTGFQPVNMANALFQNNGPPNYDFTDVSLSSGADDSSRSRTVALADYDHDGYLDIFIGNYGYPTRLLRNTKSNTGNNWLCVELQGTVSNRNGIGARLTAKTTGGFSSIREIRSGSSLGAGTEIAAYFGLGAISTLDTLRVRWPGGTVQTLTNVSANQRMTIVEPGSATPDPPDDVTATNTGASIDLDWSAVSGASSYNVYRGTSAYFDISTETPIGSPTASNYSDVDNDLTNNVIGDPDNNYFYTVTSVGSPESAASNRVGEFDFDLATGFNFISVPLLSTGLVDAQDLGESIDAEVGGDGADAIYRMNAGSWELMAFKSTGSWILTVTDALVVGGAYLVNMNSAGMFTIAGNLEPDLVNSLAVNFNSIMLPFQKAGNEGITNAENLGASIDAAGDGDSASAIYRMNSGSWELMAFKTAGSWILTVTDDVIAGYAYLINMTDSANW